MNHSPLRRSLLLACASAPFFAACTTAATVPAPNAKKTFTAEALLAQLEAGSGGRLGVAAFDVANNAHVQHRADERFPLCSTFKVMAVGAVLNRSTKEPALMQQRIAYDASDLVAHSPITGKHVGQGMTVADLCAAALQHSDNTAANLLMKLLGGPSAVTAFARSIGDETFRLDRWETDLNTAIPGDPRDTSTPNNMARSLQGLALNNVLADPQRDQLQAWLRGNTTGATRIRAGVPADWVVGDKTGAGDHGTTNDIAVLWPPTGSPIVLAIYFTQPDKAAPMRNDVVAAAARIVAEALHRHR
ncbi:MAG: class A beta-lactamase [Aquabacterium sp.]|uniref:class A beta-lactamase n=1 Tax=Aquabacterium sp. TaxID=1872578 RepID=UPI0027210940|nr:class A beta-lactamase [Aquabacterium sp.]MDO9002714.1 class A beta-lactamase [Aquabacterium sp.]